MRHQMQQRRAPSIHIFVFQFFASTQCDKEDAQPPVPKFLSYVILCPLDVGHSTSSGHKIDNPNLVLGFNETHVE